jgi:hypothetical protein
VDKTVLFSSITMHLKKKIILVAFWILFFSPKEEGAGGVALFGRMLAIARHPRHTRTQHANPRLNNELAH